jgi:hypothetical protein
MADSSWPAHLQLDTARNQEQLLQGICDAVAVDGGGGSRMATGKSECVSDGNV